MTRDQAYALLTKYLKNKNLIKHCLATEATMKALAKHFNADENTWAIVGLLHDADYELSREHPEKHGLLLFELEKDIPTDIAYAIKSHNYEYTKVLPIGPMEWSITCCDQLTGLIIACALIRPDKKLSEVTVEFVKKRFNEKSFAKGARRDTIQLCEDKLNIPLEKFIQITLEAMQGIADDLEL